MKRQYKLIFLISFVYIILFSSIIANAESIKIDFVFEENLFYGGDELIGTLFIENSQFKQIDIFKEEYQLFSSNNKLVHKEIFNETYIIPPYYSGSQSGSIILPNVPDGDYSLVLIFHHSSGISKIIKKIIIKSKKDIAYFRINEAEEMLKSLTESKINLSTQEITYLIKAEDYLEKANEKFIVGDYSIAYNFASNSILYIKSIINSDDFTPQIDDVSSTPGKTFQININSTRIESVVKSAKETKNDKDITDNEPAYSFSFTLFLLKIFLIVGVFLIFILVDIRKLLTRVKEKLYHK